MTSISTSQRLFSITFCYPCLKCLFSSIIAARERKEKPSIGHTGTGFLSAACPKPLQGPG